MSDTSGFQLFNFDHAATLLLIGMVAGLFVLVARLKRCQHLVKPLTWTLAIVLVSNELIYISGAIYKGLWHYSWGIPLQLCDLSIIAVAICLIRYKQWVWEFAYFWGLGGTLQAILTPELGVSFPDYTYIKFFLTHGCIIVGVLYMAAGLKRPIYWRSVVRVFIVTNIYSALIAVFNWAFGTNYLYLCAKPSQSSILDFFGPWPNYIFGLEFILIVSLLIYYLPYFLTRKTRIMEAGALLVE